MRKSVSFLAAPCTVQNEDDDTHAKSRPKTEQTMINHASLSCFMLSVRKYMYINMLQGIKTVNRYANVAVISSVSDLTTIKFGLELKAENVLSSK